MTITPIYTTTARATGGRDGSAATLDGSFEVKLALPKELGGNGNGNNPEQLFAAGYAACFLSAVKHVTLQDKSFPRLPADAHIEATVGIGPREDGGFALTVALKALLPGYPKDEAERLIQAAHKVCPYSHATRGNIDVTLSTEV